MSTTDCLFCKIVSGEVPAKIVRETERTLAFRDINPQAPTHVLVIPREHYPNVAALAGADSALLGEVLTERVVLTPACGLAGWAPAEVTRLLSALRTTAERMDAELAR